MTSRRCAFVGDFRRCQQTEANHGKYHRIEGIDYEGSYMRLRFAWLFNKYAGRWQWLMVG